MKKEKSNKSVSMKKCLPKILIVFCIILQTQMLVIGQTSYTGISPLRRPVIYQKPTIKSQNINSLGSKQTNALWEVWADRDNISSSNNKQINFLDKFYVVDEREDKLHIVKADNSYDVIGGIFIEEPMDYGWVEKSKLILWNTALFDEKSNFRLKILTITDPSLMKKQMEEIREGAKMLAFYNNPYTYKTNNNETPLFEVFYVYKVENGRYLLGKREEIKGSRNEQDYILGWTDSKNIQLWGQRQTLEPNDNGSAAFERKNNQVKASVFANKDQAKKYTTNTNSGDPFWDDDRYERKYDPYWKRFPILSTDGLTYETAVVSDLVQEDGTNVDVEMINKITRKYNEQRERSRKINVIFVVDGTRTMQPYIQAVKTGVLKAVQQLRDSENDFKFGAVIYRDYTSKTDDKCFELLPLTNHSEFYRFMQTVNTNDPSCYNNTISEGMFKGLYKTRSLLTGKEKETNLIILIGDAGDRDGADRYAEKEVLPILERYSISLLSLQTHSKSDIAYDDFIFQAKDLNVKSALHISEKQKLEYGELNLSSLNTKPRFEQASKDNRTLFELVNSPIAGGLQYARKNENISPDVVQSEIVKTIKDIDEKNERLLKDLNDILTSVTIVDTTKIGTFTDEAIQILMKAGFSVDEIRVLTQKNYQFLLRGYTTLKNDKVNNDLFKFVLFIDSKELNMLKGTLDLLYVPDLTSSEQCERLQETWIEILKTNYGAKREDIENRTIGELMELVTGLPSTSELLNKYTLDQLCDITIVSRAELAQILDLIKQKRDKISQVSGDKRYFFLSNDMAYYWIPQNMLP